MSEEQKIKKEEAKTEAPSQKKSNIIELEEKAKLVDDYLDQLQRVQADFENYRKRMVKDKEEFRKYALESFSSDLLLVVDNFQRAIAAAKENHKYETLMDGISIVEKQFLDLLKTQGVVPLAVNKGDAFDPFKHHAVAQEESKEVAPERVSKIMQTGYAIGERVLRPAVVTVAKKIEDKA